VPLADVPDIVWKDFASPHFNKKGEDIGVVGGRDTKSSGHGSTGPEHPNHHCDADRPFDGHPTLPEACVADADLLTAAKWNEYFDAFPVAVNELHRGILPFRVWQFFERMKDYAADEPAKFIAAVGILSHYIGDACQPLHGSTMSNGVEDEEPDVPRDSQRKDQQGHKLPAFRGEGVHSAYETQMINSAVRKGLLFPEITKNLTTDHGMKLINTGKQAAIATLTLMGDVSSIGSSVSTSEPCETTMVVERSAAGASVPVARKASTAMPWTPRCFRRGTNIRPYSFRDPGPSVTQVWRALPSDVAAGG